MPALHSPSAGPSTLWALGIGVSRYRDANFNLQFADADAQEVVAAVQRQGDGPLYQRVRALVLTNEDATRESILETMAGFLGQAGRDDVVLIFFAGHGVHDRSSGSYFFLPAPATPANLVSAGLRMSDVDDVMRVLRPRVRGVVVMLDTCHAGAFQFAPPGLVPVDDPAARLSVGEGFFLLAATRPGEVSEEHQDLGHGAFTYALLTGLRGAADADKDGWLSVAEIFAYVAREVPKLTGGTQHPYYRMEGNDLTLASVQPDPHLLLPPVAGETPERAAVRVANTIGVLEFQNVRAAPQHDWVGTALRVAFSTELSKVRALHVYAPELLDRPRSAGAFDQLAAARQARIDRVIAGSYSVVDTTIRIDARVIDTASGLQEGSESIEGDLVSFFDLQKRLVLGVLRRLRVRVSPQEGQSIEKETNSDVDAYRLLLETEVGAEEPTPPHSGGATPQLPERRSRLESVVCAAAYAADGDPDPEGAVRQVLEDYRRALQHKDLDRLDALYAVVSTRRRDALRAYLDNAGDLAVELANVIVTPRGADMAVSYTRRDRFIDLRTGRFVRLEVRVTRIVVQQAGTWKIAGSQ